MPGLLFVPVPEEKSGKNRLHLDFRPHDQAAEVQRLISLGAQRIDIGQDDVSWVVLADPGEMSSASWQDVRTTARSASSD